MSRLRDEFLSEEDLSLKDLSPEELDRVWTAWLLQAQATNDRDVHYYSHGVFAGMDLSSWLATAAEKGLPVDTNGARSPKR